MRIINMTTVQTNDRAIFRWISSHIRVMILWPTEPRRHRYASWADVAPLSIHKRPLLRSHSMSMTTARPLYLLLFFHSSWTSPLIVGRRKEPVSSHENTSLASSAIGFIYKKKVPLQESLEEECQYLLALPEMDYPVFSKIVLEDHWQYMHSNCEIPWKSILTSWLSVTYSRF